MKIQVIINNAIRKTTTGKTLADNGNHLFVDLLKAGVKPNLIGLTQELQEKIAIQTLPDNLKTTSLTVFSSHKNFITKTLNYVFAFYKLLIICATKKNFYVYIPSNTSILALWLLRIFRKRYGLYVRGAIKHSRFNGEVRHNKILYKFYNSSIKKAAFALVTGNHLFHEIKPLNIKTQRVVPMISYSKKDLYGQRNFLNFRNLLYVGRIDKEKGVEEIIEAAQILLGKNVHFEIHLVGGGEKKYLSSIEKMLEEKKLTQNIKMTGRISDPEKLKEFYCNSDIFIFPSHHEGFPRVLYEAMIFSLPIVATNLDTYKGTMIHQKNCLLVGIQNPQQLADSILELIMSSKLRERLGKEGLIYMNEFFINNEGETHASQLIKNLS